MTSRKPKGKLELLVLDLDNTLYDWVSYFVSSFYSMVTEASKITGIEKEVLLDDLREVHRHYHDSEHPFSLLEATSVTKKYSNLSRSEKAEVLDPAFYAFNKSRLANLELFPDVVPTLEHFSSNGVQIVAYTDSKLFGVYDRLNRLGIMQFFSSIYCRENESIHPNPKRAIALAREIKSVPAVLLEKVSRKPDPEILLQILRRFDVEIHNAAYVGDSLTRDVVMASDARVTSVWAKYGSNVSSDNYAKLVRVSHWTKEEVLRESELKERNVQPDIVLEESFSELKDKLAL